MGLFGSLIGFDQSMGALNAVLASHVIEAADRSGRQRIAKEVADIIMRMRPRQQLEVILREISAEDRVVQMNFIALACDNLGISPPVPNNVWTRLDNPYRIGGQVDAARISAAISAIEKQDGVRIIWPGDNVRCDFLQMYNEGRAPQKVAELLTQPKSKPWKLKEREGTLLHRTTGKAVDCWWSSVHKVFLVKSGTDGSTGWIVIDGDRWGSIDASDVDFDVNGIESIEWLPKKTTWPPKLPREEVLKRRQHIESLPQNLPPPAQEEMLPKETSKADPANGDTSPSPKRPTDFATFRKWAVKSRQQHQQSTQERQKLQKLHQQKPALQFKLSKHLSKKTTWPQKLPREEALNLREHIKSLPQNLPPLPPGFDKPKTPTADPADGDTSSSLNQRKYSMFGLFKKKEAFLSVPKELRPVLNAAFPGGEKQLEQEAHGLLENFPALFNLESSRRLVVWAKSMWVTNTDRSRSFHDMCEAINRHEKNRLTNEECAAIYSKILEQDFANRKKIF